MVGNGKMLFSALPLEFNGNLRAVADVYEYALKAANDSPVYSTPLKDSGILIFPALFEGNALCSDFRVESDRRFV